MESSKLIEMVESGNKNMDVYGSMYNNVNGEELESLDVSSYIGESMDAKKTSSHEGASIMDPFSFIEDMDSNVVIVIPIVSLVVTVLIFALVVERKKTPRIKFIKWLREFFNFRSILISGIIKFIYLFLAVLLTISSFVIMAQGKDDDVLYMIGLGLAILVFGNVLLRIIMELIMILIGLWNNTSDIRSVLMKNEERMEEKDSVTRQPDVEKPMEEQSANEQPETEQPAATQPIVEQQVATQAVAEQQAVEQPMNEQSLTDLPVTEQPTTSINE